MISGMRASYKQRQHVIVMFNRDIGILWMLVKLKVFLEAEMQLQTRLHQHWPKWTSLSDDHSTIITGIVSET